MLLRVVVVVCFIAVTLSGQCPTPTNLTTGSVVTGTLSSSCPSQLNPGSFAYRATFDGTAGQQVAIDVTAAAGGDGFPVFDTYVYLLNPSGQLIAQDDDGGGGTDSRIPSMSGSFRLPATGRYTIEVSSSIFNPGGTGAFTLRLTSPALCPSAGSITLGQTINGVLATGDCISPTRGSSYGDRYTFSGTAGQQVAVELSSGTFDVYLFMINPDGSVLAEDDDGGGGTNSRIPGTGALTLPSTGSYIIEVSSFERFATGAYTLRLSSGGPPLPPGVTSITPFVGSGQQQTFTLVYSDPSGWQDLATVYAVFNVPNAAPNACYIEFNRLTGSFRLLDNQGINWMGPSAAGSGMPLSNSQCTVNVAASSFSGAGNELTVNVSVTFAVTFTGEKNVYMQARDNGGLASDWLLLGSWWPNSGTSAVVNRYRLYNPFSVSHLHTTDLNEYNVLGTRGFTQEGVGSRIFTGPAAAGSVTAVPLYRLYSIQQIRHFWTTDRNEYVTLSRFTSLYSGEGADGFILPAPSGNAIPLFRLRFATANPPIHHWTADANENSVLTSPGRGWISEGISGYVFPPTGPVITNMQVPDKPGGDPQAMAASEPAVLAVVNGASQEEAALAPGSVVKLYGHGLEAVKSVRFEAVEAQIVSQSSNELMVIMPASLRGKEQALLQVDRLATPSIQRTVSIAPVAPAIFATDYSGRGQAEMWNEDGTLNGAEQPAARGSLVSFEATGFDQSHRDQLEVTIGGYPAEIVSVEPSAVNASRMSVRIRVPDGVKPAAALPLIMHAGPSYSQPGVLMAVK